MRRVTGMRDRIVPRVQMAPGINHPPCRSRGSAPGCRASSSPRILAGWGAAPRLAAGAQSEARRFGGGVTPCACRVGVVQLL